MPLSTQSIPFFSWEDSCTAPMLFGVVTRLDFA